MPMQLKVPSTFAVLMLTLVLLQGCAGLTTDIAKPTLKLNSLEVMKPEGLSQRFKIGLVMTNPNSVSLPVTGMTYTLSLNGYDLVSGASDQIPTLAAYSETPVTIEGSADLFSALRLLSSLANQPQSKLQYEMAAKIDLQGWRPSFNITRDGFIELDR